MPKFSSYLYSIEIHDGVPRLICTRILMVLFLKQPQTGNNPNIQKWWKREICCGMCTPWNTTQQWKWVNYGQPHIHRAAWIGLTSTPLSKTGKAQKNTYTMILLILSLKIGKKWNYVVSEYTYKWYDGKEKKMNTTKVIPYFFIGKKSSVVI